MAMSKLEFIANVRYLCWICHQKGVDLPLKPKDDLDTLITKLASDLFDNVNK